jgi:hypothetical protein
VSFIDALEHAGWVAAQELVRYCKGSWELTFDTSNWVEVGTVSNPRVFDVPVPDPHLEQWCVKLIDHLCMIEDERIRLWNALALVAETNTLSAAGTEIAQTALRSCYHRWLVQSRPPESANTIYCCAICGQLKHGAGEA